MEMKNEIIIVTAIFLVLTLYLSFVNANSLELGGGIGINIKVVEDANSTTNYSNNSENETNQNQQTSQEEDNLENSNEKNSNSFSSFKLVFDENAENNNQEIKTGNISEIKIGETNQESNMLAFSLLSLNIVLLLIILILLFYLGDKSLFSKTSSKKSNNKKIVSRRQ